MQVPMPHLSVGKSIPACWGLNYTRRSVPASWYIVGFGVITMWSIQKAVVIKQPA